MLRYPKERHPVCSAQCADLIVGLRGHFFQCSEGQSAFGDRQKSDEICSIRCDDDDAEDRPTAKDESNGGTTRAVHAACRAKRQCRSRFGLCSLRLYRST